MLLFVGKCPLHDKGWLVSLMNQKLVFAVWLFNRAFATIACHVKDACITGNSAHHAVKLLCERAADTQVWPCKLSCSG